MINHCEILKEELKRVNRVVGSKHSQIKKELHKTIEVFETNIPVFPYEVCFGLFRLVSESRSATNFMALLPFFQSIVNLGFASQAMMTEMLDFVEKGRASLPTFSAPDTQAKVQQLLLLLISRQSVQFATMAFVQKLMRLIFCLDYTSSSSKGSTNNLMRKNSVSSLLQVLILLINEVRENPDKADNLIRLLKEFILISDNVRPEWYEASATPDRDIATEVLAQVLQEGIFREQSERYEKLLISIISITNKNIHELVRTTCKDRREQQAQAFQYLLYCRCMCRASKIINREFEFLEDLTKQLTNRDNFALKIISHEAISYLFNDYKWLNSLTESKQADSLQLLLSTELNEVRAICSDERLDLTTEEPLLRHMMTSNDTEYSLGDYNPSYALKLVFKDVEEISGSLYSIYQQVYNMQLDKKCVGPMPLGKVWQQSQKLVFEMVKILLGKDMTETTLQSVLKVIEKFVNISGCFGDMKNCAIYIKLICRHCLPQDFRLVDHRHVQINKMVLNTANCLGNLLDTTCWMIIWKALENYESYYNKYLLSKDNNLFQQDRQNDVQILYQSMDSIFTESVKYELDYLMVIIDSLVQVTYECLENNFTDDSKKIFSFERIGQIYKINLFRCCDIWPSLSSSLLCITTSKLAYFRLSAIGLLNKLMPLTLSHLAAHPEDCHSKFTTLNYQRLVLEPWVNLVKCKFPELKEQIVLALNKLVIDYGHVLLDGWSCILQIIKCIGDFKSMQVIIDTFLDKVDPYMETVVDIIHHFKCNLSDPNQKYLCLTFLWTVGDHSYKIGNNQVLRRVLAILLEPEYPFVFNPEARHSSFYIFTQLLIHNCSSQGFEFWDHIFSSIKKYVLYITQELHKTTDAKIVEEAGKNILLNLVKIYKKYFQLVHREQRLDLLQLDFFYSFCAEILRLSNTDLHVLVLKQARELLQAQPENSVSLKEFKDFLSSLAGIYTVTTDLRMMKCLISYMPCQIYDIMSRCLPRLSIIFHELYLLFEKVFLLRLEAEEKGVRLQNSRIYFQQKLVMQFLRQLVAASIPNLLQLFAERFLITLEKLLNYQDYYYLKRLLPTIMQMLTTLPRGELLTKYISFLQKLALLKYNLALLSTQSTKDLPLWHMAIQQLVRLCTEWNRQSRFQQTLGIYRLFQQFLDANTYSKDKLIKTLSSENLGVYFQNEVFLLNFIVDEFILSTTFPDIQQAHVLAFARSVYAKSRIDDTESSIASFSRLNLDLLFRVCQQRADLSDLILQRLTIITLMLFQRISDTFEGYFTLQKRFGSLPINQSTVNQVVFVLGKMLTLNLPPNITSYFDSTLCPELGLDWQALKRNNCLIRSPKAHLIYFHKQLSQLVKTRDPEIRECLWQLFEVLGNMFSTLQN